MPRLGRRELVYVCASRAFLFVCFAPVFFFCLFVCLFVFCPFSLTLGVGVACGLRL